MTRTTNTGRSFDSLDVQVKGLESDVRDLKDSVVGLNAKFDQAISSISHEVRTAISGLASQFTERQKTPWAVLIGAATFLTMVLGGVGFQQLVPIHNDIKSIKDQIVPRDEVNQRAANNARRDEDTRVAVQKLQDRIYEEQRKTIDKLEGENRELKRVK